MAVTEIQDALQRIAEEVGPAVVGVGRRWGRGSGVIVAPGRVLTNAHNVGSDEVTVVLGGGDSVTGRVLGADVDGDVAVVGMDEDAGPAVTWSDAPVEVGRLVVALANPGGRGLRVTHGYVSSTERSFRGPRNRRIAGSIEHTAPLIRGSSGGPVVDADARLLGINTNRLGEGFYLAIPADGSLREKVAALSAGESPVTPRLGVGLAPVEVGRRLRRAVGLPDAQGLLVRAVEEDSAAARAGVAEGDLITEASGRPVTSADDLYEALDGAGAGLELKLLRGAEEVTASVRFGGAAGS
jgi:S1-C subfamily serine protease